MGISKFNNFQEWSEGDFKEFFTDLIDDGCTVVMEKDYILLEAPFKGRLSDRRFSDDAELHYRIEADLHLDIFDSSDKYKPVLHGSIENMQNLADFISKFTQGIQSALSSLSLSFVKDRIHGNKDFRIEVHPTYIRISSILKHSN